MPPQYVKPYVKRGKNDAIDAEAICEAMSRPEMRFVPVKALARTAAEMAIGRTEDRDTPRDPVMLQHRYGVWDSIRVTHLGQRSP